MWIFANFPEFLLEIIPKKKKEKLKYPNKSEFDAGLIGRERARANEIYGYLKGFMRGRGGGGKEEGRRGLNGEGKRGGSRRGRGGQRASEGASEAKRSE